MVFNPVFVLAVADYPKLCVGLCEMSDAAGTVAKNNMGGGGGGGG